MFGVLKSRFRCLGCCGATLEYSPERVCKIIIVVAVLLNICTRRGVPLPEEISPDDDTVDNNVFNNTNGSSGIDVRRQIIRDYFPFHSISIPYSSARTRLCMS